MSLIVYRAYLSARREVQHQLDRKLDLAAAIQELIVHQTFAGVVKDDLDRVERFDFRGPGDALTLRAEYNSRRKERFKGAGRTTPPEGIVPKSGGCFLDPYNIFWMQRGTQIPYRVWINGRPLNFLTQPFGFGRGHCTVAATRPEPQDWRERGTHTLARRASDMYSLAERLGGSYCTLFNGNDAGASIDWFHVHVLLSTGLPIQEAACRAAGNVALPPVLRMDRPFWPLPVFRIAGSREFVVSEVVQLASRWQGIAGDRATECMSMLLEDGGVVCHYVPRDRGRKLAAGFAGMVGAYECAAGVFIFSEEAEGQDLREGRKNFSSLWQILLDVRPERADEV